MTQTTAPTTHELERCSTCGRYGWHSTERCPDAATDVVPQGDSRATELAARLIEAADRLVELATE